MDPLLFHRVLLATDFSPPSRIALPYAVAFAKHFHSKLYIAHVIPRDAYEAIPAVEGGAALEAIRRKAEQQLFEMTSTCVDSKISHEVLIDHGDFWPSISAVIERKKVDLIVIGTQARHGLEKLMLGSTAEEILRSAKEPVLTVGPECSVGAQTESRVRRILFATNFSSESEPAMRYAYSLAGSYHAALHFLHVAEDVWKEPLSTRMSAKDFFMLRMLENHWTLRQEDAVPEFHVSFGPRAECILETAEHLKSELIVLGVRGSAHPRVAAHLPGPTAYDVIVHARCPVLVVRDNSRA